MNAKGSGHRVIDNDVVNMGKRPGSTGKARGIWVNNGPAMFWSSTTA